MFFNLIKLFLARGVQMAKKIRDTVVGVDLLQLHISNLSQFETYQR